jgi:16S rRNA processing protein RimM
MFNELKLEEKGRLIRTHGVNGQIKARFNEQIDQKIAKGKEPVLILFKGMPVPFFIEDLKQTGQNYIIKFKFVDNIDYAEELIGSELYFMISNPKEKIKDTEEAIINYEVFSLKHGFIGRVLNINEIPGNPVIEIQNNQNVIYVPFVDEFIEEINHLEKIVRIIPPEGLIELYL